jgi:hypothetical protein
MKIRVRDHPSKPGVYVARIAAVHCEGPTPEIAETKAEIFRHELIVKNKRQSLRSLERLHAAREARKEKANA